MGVMGNCKFCCYVMMPTNPGVDIITIFTVFTDGEIYLSVTQSI